MKRLFNWVVWKLKYKLAGKELKELHAMKLRLDDLESWCAFDPSVRASAQWIKNPHSYPRQNLGAHGEIADFREYLTGHFHPSAPTKGSWRK